jgi:polyisoprenoid-binding protein YceI
VTLPGLAPLLRRARVLPALLLAALIAAPPAARAADPEPAKETRLLDPARSSAEFEVKVLWLIGVHGHFGKVEGAVTIDRTADSAVAEARIDAERITMRTHSYEAWAKSDEFFDARAFPLIHFTSEAFPLERLRNGGDITGTLRLRGVDRRVTLAVRPSGCPDAVANTCPVEASGTILRSDFGMKSRRGTVSDKVELAFSIFLAPSATPVPPA